MDDHLCGTPASITGPIRGFWSSSSSHLAELRSKLDELTAAGYELLDEPHDTGFGMWFAFVSDPDRNTVLLSAQRESSDG